MFGAHMGAQAALWIMEPCGIDTNLFKTHSVWGVAVTTFFLASSVDQIRIRQRGGSYSWAFDVHCAWLHQLVPCSAQSNVSNWESKQWAITCNLGTFIFCATRDLPRIPDRHFVCDANKFPGHSASHTLLHRRNLASSISGALAPTKKFHATWVAMVFLRSDGMKKQNQWRVDSPWKVFQATCDEMFGGRLDGKPT